VAIVHDYLNQRGGAERVVAEMAAIWPHAPIYTSLYRPDSTIAGFKQMNIQASMLDRLPVDRSFRLLAPLYPLAFRSLGTLTQELVISSSSGWAHGVHTAPESLHVIYCHTPARWLYATAEYLGQPRWQRPLAPMLAALRSWDRSASKRADAYIANTATVRARIRRVYGIDADVVYPPVDTKRFTPRPRGERLLTVARLLPYKRIDLAVATASRAGLGLDVVGDGPELGRLRALAGPSVTFHGRIDDRAATELVENCRALCVPGTEDFGIAVIEALAAGKPVVAFAGGGVLETLEDGRSGVLFHHTTIDDLLDAIRRCDELDADPAELATLASRYSTEAFAENLRASVQRAYQRRG